MNFEGGIAIFVVYVCVLSFSGCMGVSTPSEESDPMGAERKSEEGGSQAVLTMRFAGGLVQEVRLEQGASGAAQFTDRRPLCADLCQAGLGGNSCGTTCKKQLPASFLKIWTKIRLNNATINESDAIEGMPRFAVCKTLCANNLGWPLCGCELAKRSSIDWESICSEFCHHGSYQLQGCPACESSGSDSSQDARLQRLSDMDEIWKEWCNLQCQKGEGGAACNCDLAPLI